MKFKRKTGYLVLLLALFALIVSVLAVPVNAANRDYSTQGATNKIKLEASDILERLLGEELLGISDEERAYLNAYANESVTYGTMIPASNVVGEYDVADKVLTVTASVYKYKSVSGVTMTWIPSRVTFGALSKTDFEVSDSKYTAKFCEVEEGYANVANVTYTADITFSESVINGLLNKTYNDADGWSKYYDFTIALADYNAKLELYEKYLTDRYIYNDKYNEYQKYLADKAEYDAAKLLYDKYVAELAEYNREYARYAEYLVDKQEYDKNLALYNTYVKNYAVVKEQLAVINGTGEGLPTLGRPLSGAIMGTTVMQVIENKDAIANELTGVGGEVVDLAGEATENLRELLPGYFALKTESEKYAYYSLNYESFRVNFVNLLKALDYLYDNGKVRAALNEMDMKEKYEILLAQLYYVVNALNDSPVKNYKGTGYFNSSYRINGKAPSRYTEGIAYVKDSGNAKPVSTGYPVKVSKPTEVAEVKEPTKPASVAEPYEPAVVNAPGEPPTVVEKPISPATVNAPDSSLIKADGALPDDIMELIEAYRAGKFSLREEIVGDRILTLEATASKQVLSVDEITVNFYSEIGGALLESIEADRGAYVEFTGRLPEKKEPGVDYIFAGWTDVNGEAVDMSCLDPDGKVIDLYPRYNKIEKIFKVTWVVGATETVQEYKYGQTPSYGDSVPTKAPEGAYKYVFVRWDRKVTQSITKDERYTAVFSKVPLVSDANGLGAEIDISSDTCVVDLTNSLTRNVNVSDILDLAVRTRVGLVLKMRHGTVSFSFSEIVELRDKGVAQLTLSSVEAGQGASKEYTFFVTAKDSDGVEITVPLRATVTLPYTFESPENTKIYYTDDGQTVPIRVTMGEDSLTAPIVLGVRYHSITEYTISVIPYGNVSVSVDKVIAVAGERIRVLYSTANDIRITSIYYETSDGQRKLVTDSSFIMPAESVTVGVEFEYITYTVRFASDGKLISSATYKPGQMPVAPGTPIKASDGRYEYKFIGWDKEISEVSGNIVYHAQYESVEIAKDETSSSSGGNKGDKSDTGLAITPRVLRIIVLVLAVLVYAALVFLPCLVIVIVKLIIRCRRRAKKKRKSKK